MRHVAAAFTEKLVLSQKKCAVWKARLAVHFSFIQ